MFGGEMGRTRMVDPSRTVVNEEVMVVGVPCCVDDGDWLVIEESADEVDEVVEKVVGDGVVEGDDVGESEVVVWKGVVVVDVGDVVVCGVVVSVGVEVVVESTEVVASVVATSPVVEGIADVTSVTVYSSEHVVYFKRHGLACNIDVVSRLGVATFVEVGSVTGID